MCSFLYESSLIIFMQLVKTIILKPTMDCNLRCGYCYEFIRNSSSYGNERISVERLNGIVDRFAELFPDSRILWMLHGGEPLLGGPEYIASLCNCIRKANEAHQVDYRLALQTNGTLLTDESVSVLEKNVDLLSERIVSISIDGSKKINDLTRHTATGISSFDKVVSAINRVKKSTLVFSTISVIGTHNINHPHELFEYMKKIGSNLCKFIPNYNSDSDGNPEMFGIRPMQFAEFMCEIFDCWMHDLPKQTPETRMIIEPIASIICTLTNSLVTWCEYREEKCSNFTCIYPDGEMWLCDDFIHDHMRDTAYVGNVFEASDEELKRALLTPSEVCSFDSYYDNLMGSCKDCEIYEYCKGGCITTRFEMHRKSEKLFKEYCEAKKVLINHIKKGVDLALS